MKFKAGDIVRCIRGTDGSGVKYFTEGKLYTVNSSRILEGTSSEWLGLHNDLGEDDGYSAKFFELTTITNSTPKVTESDLVAYFDIDNTLIKRVDPKAGSDLQLDYYGQDWYIDVCNKNVEFLISLKARGYYIIVHSANGWQHAKKVIELLGLNPYVDEIKSKPQKYCDDQDVTEWFGPRIYFND